MLGLIAGADIGRGLLVDNGLLLIAFDPGLLHPLGELEVRLAQYVDDVRNSLPQPGVESVRIPSENSFERRAASQRDGIEIDETILSALEGLGNGEIRY
jgi:LDH2 family malate/lactate/ureidoglycolate dehydrogenase